MSNFFFDFSVVQCVLQQYVNYLLFREEIEKQFRCSRILNVRTISLVNGYVQKCKNIYDEPVLLGNAEFQTTRSSAGIFWSEHRRVNKKKAQHDWFQAVSEE